MSDAWQNSIIESAEIAPDQLTANPMNWRQHPQRQLDALEGVMNQVGWVDRVLVNKRTGHVVDGHARIELALRRNETSVPVDYIDVSVEDEQLILATLDPISAMAMTDADILSELIENCSDDIEALLGDAMPGARVDNPKLEWTDMPEFDQQNEQAYRTITCHFVDEKAVDEFLQALDKTITDKTKYIWFPETPKTDMGQLKYEGDNEA